MRKPNHANPGQDLLDIFVTEEDRIGTDLTRMSNFLSIFTQLTARKIVAGTRWEEVDLRIPYGHVAEVLQFGYHLSHAGILVADSRHFSKDIWEGLEKGIYHLGESREVPGTFRPAILDADGRIVKCFTLQRAAEPTAVLSDLSALAMEAALHRIDLQLEKIGQGIQYQIEFSRQRALKDPFLNARDRIVSAAARPEDQRKPLLYDADTFLMLGLNALYSDVLTQAGELEHLNHLNEVDTVLAYLQEDLWLLPQYVGLRIYLFHYLHLPEEAGRVLEQYQYHLEQWTYSPMKGSRYTVMEQIHSFCAYPKGEQDFWLIQPPKMIEAVASCTALTRGPVYCVTTEERK